MPLTLDFVHPLVETAGEAIGALARFAGVHARIRLARSLLSLELLRAAKRIEPRSRTKSGLMVGLGEEMDEVKELLDQMRAHDIEIITIGQYLRPSLKHHPLIRYWHPDEFAELKAYGKALGFKHVESGPLVRSSYHAHEQAVAAHAG